MPRWSEADDAAVRAVGASRKPGAGAKWPSVDCPDRGIISGDDAKKRRSRLGKHSSAPTPAAAPAAPAGLQAFGANDGETAATTTPTSDGPCATPAPSLQERVLAVGAKYELTPVALRVTAMNRDAPPGSVAHARREIHKHQDKKSRRITRAEHRSRSNQADPNYKVIFPRHHPPTPHLLLPSRHSPTLQATISITRSNSAPFISPFRSSHAAAAAAATTTVTVAVAAIWRRRRAVPRPLVSFRWLLEWRRQPSCRT